MLPKVFSKAGMTAMALAGFLLVGSVALTQIANSESARPRAFISWSMSSVKPENDRG